MRQGWIKDQDIQPSSHCLCSWDMCFSVFCCSYQSLILHLLDSFNYITNLDSVSIWILGLWRVHLTNDFLELIWFTGLSPMNLDTLKRKIAYYWQCFKPRSHKAFGNISSFIHQTRHSNSRLRAKSTWWQMTSKIHKHTDTFTTTTTLTTNHKNKSKIYRPFSFITLIPYILLPPKKTL